MINLKVVTLLNIANIFRKENRIEEAIETEILFGLSLINARRFLQAAEVLRKISLYFINQNESNKLNARLSLGKSNIIITLKDS